MSTIKISDLRPAGSELFSDSEGYMSSLSEEELAIQGGVFSSPFCAVAASIAVTAISLTVASPLIAATRR